MRKNSLKLLILDYLDPKTASDALFKICCNVMVVCTVFITKSGVLFIFEKYPNYLEKCP